MDNKQNAFSNPNGSLALVLFMDIVDFSKRDEAEMQNAFSKMDEEIGNWILTNSLDDSEFNLKSTGDGILFTVSPSSNKKIDLLDLAKRLQVLLKCSSIKTRQGVHIGSIYKHKGRIMDDVIGSAVNECQRIMDCGDADHILISKRYKDTVVSSFPEYAPFCKFISETVLDKHGNKMEVYNYFKVDAFGNSSVPCKIACSNAYLKEFAETSSWTKFLDACEEPVELSRAIDATVQINETYESGSENNEFNSVFMSKRQSDFSWLEFWVSYVKMPLNFATHIDFQGHVTYNKNFSPVGEIKLIRFLSEVFVFDASDKVKKFHDKIGYNPKNSDTIHFEEGAFEYRPNYIDRFLAGLRGMEIKLEEFKTAIDSANIDISGKTVLIYTGLSKHLILKNGTLLRHSPYFFNPYIGVELADFLKDSEIKMLGIDAYQPENPIINFYKDGKMPYKQKREIERTISELQNKSLHYVLLGANIPILENLTNLKELLGKKALLICPPIRFSNEKCTNTECGENRENCIHPDSPECINKDKCDDNSITRAFALILK